MIIILYYIIVSLYYFYITRCSHNPNINLTTGTVIRGDLWTQIILAI
jgi:hypothetical protein